MCDDDGLERLLKQDQDIKEACKKMGHIPTTSTYFILNAIDWLSEKYGDLHLEYHEEEGGWQVSTCHANGAWGEDSWVRGNGSLMSALLEAVKASK